MTVSLPINEPLRYAISERALARWAQERLQVSRRDDGGAVYSFVLSGSTCNNRPLEAVMVVTVDSAGRIQSATLRPAATDTGCDAMCAAGGEARRFLEDANDCREVIGRTIQQAAFRDWQAEASGCFCTAGNRRHKWRNVFQTLHYAITRGAR